MENKKMYILQKNLKIDIVNIGCDKVLFDLLSHNAIDIFSSYEKADKMRNYLDTMVYFN